MIPAPTLKASGNLKNGKINIALFLYGKRVKKIYKGTIKLDLFIPYEHGYLAS